MSACCPPCIPPLTGGPRGVQSDGNASSRAKDGYAVATHRYEKPGHYLVRVERRNRRGEPAVAHLHVRVAPRR